MNKLIIFILILGVIYKLFLTGNGNFLFNMDNARDLIDVREMVVLQKIRLIGPTSAIEGFFTGPAWYYLLAIPFIISGGDPYSTIILQIVMWVIGGFFLLKIVSKWNKFLVIPVGFIWIASNYISLTTSYAFNPNPVTLLTPLFIYLLYKYLETSKFLYVASSFFLGGLFFNFEMNFGVFIPPLIFLVTLIVKRRLLLTKNFWLGSLFFILCLLPQVLFEIRHNFFMTNSVINYLRNSSGGSVNLTLRFYSLFESFLNVFSATLMNQKTLTQVILLLLVPVILYSYKKKGEVLVLISSLYIILPFLFYLFLPVTVNPWHLGAEAVALIILLGYLISAFWRIGLKGKVLAVGLSLLLLFYSFTNITNFFFRDRFKENMDPSAYTNEVAAIDYVYQKAEGKNFKAYTYLPSVIDYPYQYLFWWYGRKQYGYLPADYAYLPNKFEYISNKKYFSATEDQLKQREDSGLVFLIKEPNHNYTRFGWEGDFVKLESLGKEMVGPIEIEIKKETN